MSFCGCGLLSFQTLYHNIEVVFQRAVDFVPFLLLIILFHIDGCLYFFSYTLECFFDNKRVDKYTHTLFVCLFVCLLTGGGWVPVLAFFTHAYLFLLWAIVFTLIHCPFCLQLKICTRTRARMLAVGKSIYPFYVLTATNEEIRQDEPSSRRRDDDRQRLFLCFFLWCTKGRTTNDVADCAFYYIW